MFYLLIKQLYTQFTVNIPMKIWFLKLFDSNFKNPQKNTTSFEGLLVVSMEKKKAINVT